jgi:RNA polymerase sigma-70 factor (ECF subfamily)
VVAGFVTWSGVTPGADPDQAFAEPQPVVWTSFEAWYRESYAELLSAMIVAAGDVPLANEATDEAFARAYERWRRVRAMRSPRGWTYRVAVNVLRRSYRRRRIEESALLRWSAGHASAASEPDFSIEVLSAVQALPLRVRTAVALHYVGGLTESETAEVMKVNPGTVARHLHDARSRLASSLGPATAFDDEPEEL